MSASPSLGRSRALRQGVAGGLLARAVAAVAPLVLVPIMLHLLGREVYGLWMAVGAMSAALIFADLGLGNTLLSRLAEALGSEDFAAARILVSSAYAVVLGISSALILVVLLLAVAGLWHHAFGVGIRVDGVPADPVIAVCLTGFLLGVPALLITRVLYAAQRSLSANLAQAGASLVAIPAVLLGDRLHLGPIGVLALALYAGPAFYAVLSVAYFAGRGRAYAPRPQSVRAHAARELVGLGVRFMALSVLVGVAAGWDNYLVGLGAGMAAAAVFAIPGRLFAQVMQLITMINLPLWPAVAAALARGESDWVRRSTARMVALSAALGLTALLGAVAVGPWLIHVWTRQPLPVSRFLLAGFGLWCAAQAALSPFFMVLNARTRLGGQFVGWAVLAVVSLPLKYLCARAGMQNLVPWVGTGCYVAILGPVALLGYRACLRSPVEAAR